MEECRHLDRTQGVVCVHRSERRRTDFAPRLNHSTPSSLATRTLTHCSGPGGVIILNSIALIHPGCNHSTFEAGYPSLSYECLMGTCGFGGCHTTNQFPQNDCLDAECRSARHGCTMRLHDAIAQCCCTTRSNNAVAQCGCTMRLHNAIAQLVRDTVQVPTPSLTGLRRLSCVPGSAPPPASARSSPT